MNERVESEDTHSRNRECKRRRDEGSVTIYFITATAAFVLLTALLIDFARIAAFRKQAEISVKSGVRSALSSFDPIVYEKYGLFIRGGDSANELFLETLQGNVPETGSSGALKFLDTRWEETGVTESRPLASHDVFNRQVLEEMKYKAPIDLTLEMAERFGGLSSAMEEAASTVDLLEKMRKAYEKREAALDGALAIQTDVGEAIQQLLAAEVNDPPIDVNTGATAGSVNTIVDIAVGYEDYVSKRQEDEARRAAQRAAEEQKDLETETEETKESDDKEAVEDVVLEGPKYEAIVISYETGTNALAMTLNNRALSIISRSNEAGEDAIAKWLIAKEANEEMRALAEQAKVMPTASSTEQADGEIADETQSLEEIRKTADELVLEASFFEDYAAEIGEQRTLGQLLGNEASAFSSLAVSVPGSTGKGAYLRDGASRLQNGYSNYNRLYGANGTVGTNRLKVLQAHRSKDNEIKQEEQKARSAWSGATNFLASLSGATGSEEDKISFEQANELYRINKDWNHSEEEQARVEASSDPSAGRDQAMSETSGLLKLLEGSALGIRDQLYFSEYTISRLSRYDPVWIKGMLKGEDAPLDIHLQETEYILYGINNPAGNIAAAYSEIFAFRLAIRTMEGLIECRSMGHPLLVLAAALVYGIGKALMDLRQLVENGNVQLSKTIKVDTVYSDYLRLFLLAHGGSSNQVARMIAIMEHATGLDFRGAYTYASAEGSASVRLWFFPGLLKMLGKFGDLGGTVKGNRYESTYTADSSYQ
ncbi:hypothetical protein [Cohnella lupini]|uniref:Uncharacterized protein n=1 Tax=Cohnella lupini TaxID=1294267 RepID=A0A3D9HZ03_9BACL|nr:hypothetical protein [Cohnella lupini]RED54758.1 hypothetical protein DFP95_12114 [Cohnella lupini]